MSSPCGVNPFQEQNKRLVYQVSESQNENLSHSTFDCYFGYAYNKGKTLGKGEFQATILSYSLYRTQLIERLDG